MDEMMAPPEGMAPEAMGEEGGAGAYTICISVAADQTLSVSVEKGTEAAEGMDPAAAPEAPSSPVPAKTIKEALTMALETFNAKGVLPQNNQGADESFDAGYNSGPGGAPEGAM